jgi:hypothetical protein
LVPFDAFELAVGMPTDVATLVIGSAPVSGSVMNRGILAGYEWTCQLLKFGCYVSNATVSH